VTPRPTDAGSVAERVYAEVEPMTRHDAEQDWALLVYLGGLLNPTLQEVEDYAADTPTRPGWAGIMTVDDAPTKALPWLAQFVGVQLEPGLSDADQRDRIRSTDGWKRGTRASIIGAAKQYLTGDKLVIIRERDPAACATEPAYGLTVITYASETPDSAKVLAAILAQKPAGIVLNYVVASGQDYESVFENFATYQALKNAYATYQGVATDTPGT
jgi:hypothetical protein